VTTAAVFLGSMDSGTVPVILPKIEAVFPNTPTTTFSFVLTAYTIALAALVVVSGRLGDRTGRRRMFLLGGVTFIVGQNGLVKARQVNIEFRERMEPEALLAALRGLRAA